jgi:glutathione S-transferase
MKLYYSPGVCSQAVHIALSEAGVSFDLDKVDLSAKTTERGADFSRINPLGYVPALELDEGEILLEAPAILQYVADLKPESGLAPASGTLDRVRLQEHLNFTASELHKSFGPFFAPVKPEGALKDQALAKLRKRFEMLETRLNDGRRYVLGDTFTVADTYTFVVANWAGLIDFDMSPFPNVRSYIARVADRPKVKEVLQREGLAA